MERENWSEKEFSLQQARWALPIISTGTVGRARHWASRRAVFREAFIMAERKAFLLRLPADLFEAMQRWARDDLRSLNAQIEFALRESLRRTRRLRDDAPPPVSAASTPNPNQASRDTPDISPQESSEN